MKPSTFSSRLVRTISTVLASGLLAACAAAPVADEEASATGQEALSQGACSASFGSCLADGGGVWCAATLCGGACKAEVQQCVSSGGGMACANKCSAGCVPQSTYAVINTTECGYVIQLSPKGQSTTIYGTGTAVCTKQCNGTLTNCSSILSCSAGYYRLDGAGNPR